MTTIERLTATIEDLRERITAGSFRSEAEISRGVVTRILNDLGWPIFDVRVVTPEFKIGVRKVDYALCHPPEKPAVLLEVKDLGKADGKAEEQLFEYCFRYGVPIAVLTDGRIWSLFFPAGQGRYAERRFARIDLIKDGPEVAAGTLVRYLQASDVRSGEARSRAQRDYETARQEREAASKYATVWRRVLSGPDALLLDLFIEEVQQATGVRPDRQRAAEFIRAQAEPVDLKPKPRPPRPPTTGMTRRSSLTFEGRTEHFGSGAEAMSAVFKVLASRDSDFCRRFSQEHTGRVNRYVAKTREELYPDSPKLRRSAKRLPGDWWLGTHCSNNLKLKRIEQACTVAGLRFGHDLSVHIPVGSRSESRE